MKTRAILFTAENRVEIREIQLPELGPEEVIVRAECSGVSVGTDGWILTNQFTWGGAVPYPVVPGYQRAGRIEAIGAKVESLHVGQRVAATVSRLEGTPASSWGGHLEYGVHHQGEVYPLDERVSFSNGAQMVVAQVGYNAASRVPVKKGERVLVLGDGCIGQMACQALRHLGARVILGGHRAERLKLAKAFSADEVFETRDEAWLSLLSDSKNPILHVVDTVQSASFFEKYFPHLLIGSSVVFSGFSPKAFPVDVGELQKRQIGILTVSGWTRKRNEETLELMRQGFINMDPLITHDRPAAEASQLFKMISKKSEPFLGVNFRW